MEGEWHFEEILPVAECDQFRVLAERSVQPHRPLREPLNHLRLKRQLRSKPLCRIPRDDRVWNGATEKPL